MKIHHYILDERGEPALEPSIMKWARWLDSSASTDGLARRVVAQTEFAVGWVSTEFLGLDHNFSSIGPPLLWETTISGGARDGSRWRCSGSRQQALSLHAQIVARLLPPRR